MLGTDHDAFFNVGMNQINAALGINGFVGNFAGPYMPVDESHPLIAYPADASFSESGYTWTIEGRLFTRLLWDDTSTGTHEVALCIIVP